RRGWGLGARLMATPAPLPGAGAGLVVFTPARPFIAAIQVIATAEAGLALSALGLVMVIVIYLATIWLPFLAYLAAPDLTSRKLTAFNAWLLTHGRAVLVIGLMVAGAALAADGVFGRIRRS